MCRSRLSWDDFSLQYVMVILMKEEIDKIYDVIVIGGGPSGMMAAARASERGRSVLLLEKNSRLGKKLSISGGGRCNVTNNKPDVRTMLDKYGDAGKFLFSTYTQHGVKESIEWFVDRGVNLRQENEDRLFPETNSAETICQALEVEVEKQAVTVELSTAVRTVDYDKDQGLFIIHTTKNETYQAKSCVVSTGGNSRPDTGSTGDGFGWIESLGHVVHPSSLALVPLALKDKWVSNVSGVTLQDVKITLVADGEKQLQQKGKVLFTHVGVSGPTVLNMSSVVGELLKHSKVELQLDLFPEQDEGALRNNLTQLLAEVSNQKVRNSLSQWLPKALVTAILEQLDIDGETEGHSLSSDDRKRIVTYFKCLPLRVARLLGAEKAVISGGGVSLKEIDFKTMQSRIVPGLYVTGDLLNVNRPSGGYSLQLSWSTGWVAGNSV